MIKSPFISAIFATTYIVAIASFLYYVPKRMVEEVDSVLVPIMMLSLFVLSAAVMGFLFLAKPLELYLAGERVKAFQFFGKTVAVFAAITLVIVLALVFVGKN
ncbi:MAG: hypothetical protein A2675_02115 [Candidatus Yonathbacteria bacterium RIFCSPHIGHO2_01_FULL_51_10]|uniref:Uncharacterized protein n=1 Tax=Candidatus Yonathbacteria bacterium RIFCSPHIGHO2_01_FULL_51_10 TaxID=1802723 RepID=A0A1G2SC25_9BACT|nr:MAG: hypothetical protein A2675_02115 [Candidatus Yonathbacteria bacterium RIFCSPHIGHO2_01_FULL_51_10]